MKPLTPTEYRSVTAPGWLTVHVAGLVEEGDRFYVGFSLCGVAPSNGWMNAVPTPKLPRCETCARRLAAEQLSENFHHQVTKAQSKETPVPLCLSGAAS